jgi:cytochrome c-type biogenesis protein CcmE
MSTGAKIGITVAVIIGAVGYMVYTTVSSGDALEYFKHVEEVTGAADQLKGQRLQVHGNVVAGTIAKERASMDFLFALHREGKWLDVTYHGLVPDNFRDCAELVVKGRVVDDHTFAADEISAKCPSKYDGKRQTGCGPELKDQVLARRRK